MKISAHIQNHRDEHHVFLITNGNAQVLSIAAKSSGYGSSVNGGELLCLAMATCYCNDLYREAAKRGIKVEQVEVEVISEFGEEGEPAKEVSYRATVKANASEDEILELMKDTDRVAEIQNTLRKGLSIRLEHMEAINISSTSDQYSQIISDMKK